MLHESPMELRKGRGFKNCEIFGLPSEYLEPQGEKNNAAATRGEGGEPLAKKSKSQPGTPDLGQ